MSSDIDLGFIWESLEIEVLDPHRTTLFRLYSHAGGDWKPAPPKYRTLRVDPPRPHQSKFAVLYTANRLDTIGQECGLLSVDSNNKWTIDIVRESHYKIATYSFKKGGIFIPLDGRNAKVFGLDRLTSLGTYDPYQKLSKALFDRYSHFVHGISWRSFHRHQSGTVYAIWHSKKNELGLKIESSEVQLAGDKNWETMLSNIPGLSRIC